MGWEEVATPVAKRGHRYKVRAATSTMPDGRVVPATRAWVPTLTDEGRVDPRGRMCRLRYAGLQPGVRVELSEQHDFFSIDDFGPHLWRMWLLRTASPCRRRWIVLASAEPFSFDFKVHHAGPEPAESRVGSYRVLTWDLRDVPGLPPEPERPGPLEYLPFVDATTMPDWSPVHRALRPELGRSAALVPHVRGDADDAVRGAATEREKAQRLYAYVCERFRYGRPISELDNRAARNHEQMGDDLRGDCKDKSNLLTAMLLSQGIDATVAVLTTRDTTTQPLLPGMRFDHAIVRATVDGETVWLDPAPSVYSYGSLPTANTGVRAMRVDTGAFEPIVDAAPEDHTRRFAGTLTLDGRDATLTGVCEMQGERAARLRDDLLHAGPARDQVLVSWLAGESDARVELHEATGEQDLLAGMAVRYTATIRDLVRPVGDLLLLQIPWPAPLRGGGVFSVATRAAPICIPVTRRDIDRIEVALPEGYEPYGLPAARTHEHACGTYELAFSAEPGRLIATRTTRLVMGDVAAEAFAAFRRTWASMVRGDTLDVVLARRGSVVDATPEA